jgi:mono/diheme cytochrome c family protein
MSGRLSKFLAIVFVGGLTASVAGYAGSAQDPKAAPKQSSGWTLPPDAADKKSPLTVDDKVLAQGKAIFKDKCEKCHGATGVGDGPDADPDVQEDMDLTNPKRADRNPDGVVFYKVANGRKKPKMPVFKDELQEQQIWQVVAYVQTLRKK